ncbi:Hypothetical_protein [Hexamita inflata]|uniref:Hypothetical_protein n=1 Tax=Hexamita inflata TaxID=28002 RepID=A0AA86PD80_9EUKA|nr:Hypothetical protein HINF_LOCUS24485 [Hexamita inflata]
MSQNYLAENIYFAQDNLILVARLKPASLFSEILFLETSRQILSRFPDYIKCKDVCKTRECVQFRSLCSLTLLNIVYIIVYIIIYIIVYKRSKSIIAQFQKPAQNDIPSCSQPFVQFHLNQTRAVLHSINSFTKIHVQIVSYVIKCRIYDDICAVYSTPILFCLVEIQLIGRVANVSGHYCKMHKWVIDFGGVICVFGLVITLFICECTILQCFIRLVILLSPRTNT